MCKKMKKYIYQILNKINNKCYIGQSKNCQRRFKEHKTALNNNKHENSYLQYAWNKYGSDNFEFKILEDKTENYNDLEKQWIKKLNSIIPHGYNVLPGGEEPPILKGNNSYRKKISELESREIKKLLLENVGVEEIHKKYSNITVGQINRINNGEAWHDEKLQYPLQDRMNVGHDVALKIQNDLMNTKDSQKLIAKRYGVCRTFVTGINNGTYKEYRTLVKYPIRSYATFEISKDLFDKIFSELQHTTKSQIKIAEEFNVSKDTVKEINLGTQKRCKNVDFKYPIRTRRKTHKL